MNAETTCLFFEGAFGKCLRYSWNQGAFKCFVQIEYISRVSVNFFFKGFSEQHRNPLQIHSPKASFIFAIHSGGEWILETINPLEKTPKMSPAPHTHTHTHNTDTQHTHTHTTQHNTTQHNTHTHTHTRTKERELTYFHRQ